MDNQNTAFCIENMNDESSAQNAKSLLMKLNGVYDVITDVNSKRIAIEYDGERLNEEILKGTLEDSGYIIK
jgi:copper chaperone CopZ